MKHQVKLYTHYLEATMPRKIEFQRRHFEFLADNIGPLMGTPTDIERLADILSNTNPMFNRDRFTDRAIKVWEYRHIPEEERGQE